MHRVFGLSQFNRYMESLKASTLTAFYTDNPIVDAISDA